MDRTVLHCDCNGFYASVECVLNPSLRNVPMAVGGNEKNRHGIILAKNELAKKYNIQTAETLYSARKKCPELVIVPPHHDVYREYSHRVNAIYEQYTDLVEPFGIDESWLDVTGSRRLFGDGKTIADELRRRVRAETGLTISVGVSFNKVFAKLGSDYKKPDATTVIMRGDVERIVYPLPVGALLYVGKRTEKTLLSMGIKTIGDLAAFDEKTLAEMLGKSGAMLSEYARGLDESPVRSVYEEEEIQSVGNGMTFDHDLTGEEEIRHGVLTLCEKIAFRMRAHKVKCTTVQVQIKDPQFKVISRQKKLERAAYSSREIFDAAMDIIHASWQMYKPVRMITVTGSSLINEHDEVRQLSLFDEEDKTHEKLESLEKTMDLLREKFGNGKVSYGYKSIEKENNQADRKEQ